MAYGYVHADAGLAIRTDSQDGPEPQASQPTCMESDACRSLQEGFIVWPHHFWTDRIHGWDGSRNPDESGGDLRNSVGLPWTFPFSGQGPDWPHCMPAARADEKAHEGDVAQHLLDGEQPPAESDNSDEAVPRATIDSDSFFNDSFSRGDSV